MKTAVCQKRDPQSRRPRHTTAPSARSGRLSSSVGSRRQNHSDTAVDQALIDIADGIEVRDEQFLRLQATSRGLRRLAPAGENDLRPEGFNLRRGHTGHLAVELIAYG